MRVTMPLLVGALLGATLMFLTLTGGENAYIQRRIRDATTNDEITRWIEQDNCHPQTVGDRILYYRCPRFRW